MARKAVVQIQCDRCSRVEHREEMAPAQDSIKVPDFRAKMEGLDVSFSDLCTPCLKTVKNHLEQIAKKIEGLSPDRVSKLDELVKGLPRNEEEKPRAPQRRGGKVTPLTVHDSDVTPMTVDE